MSEMNTTVGPADDLAAQDIERAVAEYRASGEHRASTAVVPA